ncbi:TPA: SGNH/GDSL hydrolase family protein [Serratia marcescens]
MTTHNTGNPVGPNGSSDPRDLFDNAQVFDLLINSNNEKVVGRIGNDLFSWFGVAQNLAPLGKAYTIEQANAAIASGEIPEGGYFFVLSSNGETVADQYKNINGVAKFLGYGFVKSKMVTDLYQYLGVRLYTQSANVNNYYVVASGANAGKLLKTTTASTVVTYIPVKPGQTYIIKATDFRANYFAVALKEDNELTETTLGLATLSGTGNYRSFKIPADSTAKYAFINVMIENGGFDIRSELSITFDYIKEINGIDIYDDYSRNHLIDDSVSLIEETGGQLYDSLNNKTGYFVRALGGNAGNIEASNGAILNVFPVVPGKTYTVAASSFTDGFFAITLKTDNQLTGPTLGLVTLSGSGSSRSFTVPAESTAKFAFMNVYLPLQNWDIRPGLQVSGPIEKVKGIKAYGIYDETARKLIADLENSIPKMSVLTGKSWVVVGDSITEKNFRSNKNYHAYVSDNVGGMTVYNYGISGTGYYGRSAVADTITQVPDYLTVFFGTNDWGQVNNSKPLGSFLDTGTATISGCINTCLLGIITKFYSKKVGVFTPLPRLNNWGSNAAPNAVGYTLEQLSELIKRYADHYSIPCLDLYHDSNLPVYVPAANTYYFTYPGGSAPDGLHPNDAGHIVMAAKIQAFLESM